MNKVIAVNLNGNAYQLEDIGYEQLRSYLDRAAAALAGNPDRDEILADIEQAIADKFRASLDGHRTVVATKDVERVIAEMGPVEPAAGEGSAGTAANADAARSGSFSSAPGASGSEAEGSATGTAGGGPRRLYLIREGAMIGGVCNGLAAYLGVDVSLIRVAFALLAFLWGAGVAVYILLMIILPEAKTPEQRAAAEGLPKTAQEFIRRAKEGYYEGMRTWGDRRAHRAWRRRFKRDMRTWGHDFKREMKDHAAEWRRDWEARAAGGRWAWHRGWGYSYAPVFPLLCLARLALCLLLCFVVLSLVLHHGVWSYHLPIGVPLWIGIVFAVLLYHVIAWPFRIVRHHSEWETIASVAVVAIIVWWANRHSPEFHHFLAALPAQLRQFADSIRDWWRS